MEKGYDQGTEKIALEENERGSGSERENGLHMDRMLSEKDMADLIYINDAYLSLNRFIFGEEKAIGLDEGALGPVSRVQNILTRHMPRDAEGVCPEADRILEDISISAKKRAEKLMDYIAG